MKNKNTSQETEITKALQDNTNWNGSADEMWKKVAPQLQTKKPWWAVKPVWMSTAAAAIIFLMLLANNSPGLFPSWQYRATPNGADGANEEQMNIATNRAIIVEDSTMLTMAAPVDLSIQIPMQTRAGEQLDIEIMITASHQAIRIASSPPILRLVSTENTLESASLVEVTIDSWKDLVLSAFDSVSLTLPLSAPNKSGWYRIQLELEALIEDRTNPVFQEVMLFVHEKD